MRTKTFAVLGALVALAMIAAACAPTATPTAAPTTAVPTTAATTPAPTTAATTGAQTCPLPPEAGATITYSGWSSSTAEDQVNRDAITRFEAVCPGVTVNYVPIPTDYETKMKAQMAGGTAPDVFYINTNILTDFGPTGQLLPLDTLMAQAGVKLSDFIPALTAEFVQNGVTYGLPKDWSTLGLVYLPAAFTAAGIPEPTSSWTYTDLVNAAKTIATKTNYAGFCMAADAVRLWPWVASNGGDYSTSDYKTATLDTTQVTDAATQVANMKADGSLKTPTDLSVSWCGEAIGKQVAAMTLEGTWMISYMQTTYPDVVYKAVLPPSGSVAQADMTFTNALGVNAATKYPNAAADFVFFYTGLDNTLAVQNTGFAFSPHPEAIAQATDPIAKAMLPGGTLPATKPEYWGPYTGALETVVANALDRVFLNQQTVAQSFAQAETEGNNALAGH